MAGTKKKTPSIQALENIKEILIEQCRKAHYRARSYDKIYDRSEELAALNKGKEEIIAKISKEIEEYAVRTYKKYGVMVVPFCHRKTDDGPDRLEIDLKVKVFPELKDRIEAVRKCESKYQTDLQRIDNWYYAALQAVTKREELPDVPEFKPAGVS
jgi:hypothetical protein